VAKPRCRNCGERKWTDDGRCHACREFPTLGFQVLDWTEDKCAIPDRDQVGDPFIPTGEQARFTLNHYRINPKARIDKDASAKMGRSVWRNVWVYERGSQLTRSQKWGKGPFSGAITCAEAAGPVLFDGWDAEGQPVGRPWPTPVIQITALSEDQTDNVWTALLPMIELGDFNAEIPETGKLRIYLPHGGLIEPVTSSARSRLGQRVTFLVQDQTESWTQTNGGRALADNQRRNIGGMGGRWLSTCNAWDPTEESVAQYTAEEEIKEGGVYLDDIEPPDNLSVRNKSERRRALKLVYGDSWWVDLDRVDSEIRALLPRDPAQAERWYLNRKQAAEAKAFSGERWDNELAKPGLIVPDDSLIVIGVDGARFVDALAMVATHVESGHQWPLGIWERPESAPHDYEHPFDQVDGAMQDAFEQFDVWRVYVDPQYIDYLLEKWQGDHGDKRVIPWYTNRPRQIAWAVRNYSDAQAAGDLSHSGDPDLARHIKNAVRWKLNVHDDDHRKMHTIGKDRPDSPRKMDGAMAGVLSWEARGDAVAADATTAPSTEVQEVRLRDSTEEPVVQRGDLRLRGDRYLDRKPGGGGSERGR
jgi:hypothetical protein